MKKIILLLIISILTFSCASVKKNKIEEYQKVTTEKTEKEYESSDMESGSEQKTENKYIEETLYFSIIPDVGKVADFTLNYGGKLLTGSTTGTLNFSTNRKASKIQTFTKTYTIEKKIKYWYTITKTQFIYRLKTKTKTVTVDYPWYFWAVLVPFLIIVWELLKKHIPVGLRIFKQLIKKI